MKRKGWTIQKKLKIEWSDIEVMSINSSSWKGLLRRPKSLWRPYQYSRMKQANGYEVNNVHTIIKMINKVYIYSFLFYLFLDIICIQNIYSELKCNHMSFEENVYLQVLTTLSCCRIFSLLSIIPRCFSLAVHNPSKKKKLFGFLVSFISLLEVELCIRAITQYVHFCAFTQQNIFEILKCCCSVAKFCLTLHSPMDCRAPGLPVTRYLLVFAQDHVY